MLSRSWWNSFCEQFRSLAKFSAYSSRRESPAKWLDLPLGTEDRIRYERPVQIAGCTPQSQHRCGTLAAIDVAGHRRPTSEVFICSNGSESFVFGGSPVPPPSACRETFRAPGGDCPAPFPADRRCSSRLRQLHLRAQHC